MGINNAHDRAMAGDGTPLVDQDRLFWEIQRHYRVRPMVCGLYLALAGPPDRQRLQTLVQTAIEAHPRLGRRIVDHGDGPRWDPLPRDRCAVVRWKHDPSLRSHADFTGRAAARMNEPLEDEGSLWQWQIVSDRPEGDRQGQIYGLWLRWQHALTDAEGMLDLLGALCAAPDEGPIGDLRTMNPALLVERKPIGLDERWGWVRGLTEFIGKRRAIARMRHDSPRTPGSSEIEAQQIELPLSPEHLASLARHHDVSSNDVVVAASIRAIERYHAMRGQPSGVALLCPISRRTPSLGVVLGNHSRALRVVLDTVPRNPTALLPKVGEVSARALAGAATVPYGVYRALFRLPRRVLDRVFASAPPYIANYLPWAEHPQSIAGQTITALHGFAPPLPFHGCTFAYSRYAGRITCALVTDSSIIDDAAAMKRQLELAVHDLVGSIEMPSTPPTRPTRTKKEEEGQPKRRIRPVPLALGYALSKLAPLHRWMPDRMLYRLPMSWNFEMVRSFLTHRLRRVYIDIHCTLDPPPSYSPRTEVVGDHALEESDVRRFYRDGFLGPFELCPREQMVARSEQMWSLWDSPSKTYPPGTYKFIGDQKAADGSAEMTNEQYATRGLNARDKHLDDPSLLDLYAHPAIVDRIAQLLGPDLLLWRTQFFPKYPHNGGTGWHQASSYLNETMRVATLQPPDLSTLFQLTVWIALTDSTRENGCLRIVRGTHHEIQPMVIEEYDPATHANNKSDRFGTKLLRTFNDVDPTQVVDLEMKAGQFVIFTERVMHGSLPNITSDESRLGMSGRYVLPEVKIHNPWVLGDGGLDIAYLRIAKLRLDRWRALLVRGTDRLGTNGGRVQRYVGPHARDL